MARYTGAVCKMCRREGKKLYLKGERCYSNKCAFERRSYAPGQHGQSRKKTSEYGLQLRAKQQLVVHGHYKVNGKKVDVPSYLLKAGDVVSIKEKSRESDKIKAVLETNSARPVPAWLEADADKLTAKVIALPERDQIMVPVEEHLIVELYSK